MFTKTDKSSTEPKFKPSDILAIITGFDLSKDAYLGALLLAKHIMPYDPHAAMSTVGPYVAKLFPELAKMKTDSKEQLLEAVSKLNDTLLNVQPMSEAEQRSTYTMTFR